MPVTIINQLKTQYNYSVLLNGKIVHKLKQDETTSLPLEKGENRLNFKHAKTQPIIIKDGDTIILEDHFPFTVLNHWGFQLMYFVFLLLINNIIPNQLKLLFIPILLLLPALPYLVMPHFIVHRR